MYEPIHEYGDSALRPTNKAWKCPKCGVELLTVSCIVSHKQRCTNNPTVKKPLRQKTKAEIEREQKLKESLKQFKQRNHIR
jgi:hypothetical protein